MTWTTDEPASSHVRYGTSPTRADRQRAGRHAALNHSVALSGLTPGTTYHYRVTSVDAAGNTATSPVTSAAPATFTVPQPETTVVDSTVGEFGAGTTGASTYVGATGSTSDGEVVLRPTVGTEFDGTALPAGWYGHTRRWRNRQRGTSRAGRRTAGDRRHVQPGRALEFVGTFGPAPFQHLGFGDTYDSQPWAMFSSAPATGCTRERRIRRRPRTRP